MSNAIGSALRWISNEVGLRFMLRRRAACIVAVLTMALALGANTVVFSVLKAFLLSSFALPEPDRLFVIAPVRELTGRGSVVFADAYPNYEYISEAQRSFSDVACILQTVASWDDEGEARALQAARVTASFFSTTAVLPLLGRAFDAAEQGPSPAPVVVISHDLWQGAMAGDTDVIGRTMRINGGPHTIIGVMPPGFVHPLPTDVWLPFDLTGQQWTSITGARTLSVYGRLKDGVSREAARAELVGLTDRLVERSPDNRDFQYNLRTIGQVLLPGADRTVLFMQAGALLLLLLAVLNLAALLIAWGFDRQREMAIRLALGARSGRVTRMLVMQSMAVVGAGGVAGLAIASAAIPAIRQLDVSASAALFMANLALDLRVLMWSAVAAALSGVLAGVLPSWFSRGADVGDTLRSSSRSASLAPAAVRWQKGMVVAQSTLTVTIVSAAVLLGISFRNLADVPHGFTPGDVVVARVQLPPDVYPTHADRVLFATRLLESMSGDPELEVAGFSSTLPVSDVPWGGRFFVEQPDGSLTPEPLLLHFRRVSDSYFATMDVPIVQGRYFEERDDATHPPVAIVSRALATRLWPGEDPIGRPLYRVGVGSVPPSRVEVVGVVGDVMDAGYTAPAGETVYLPWSQASVGRMSIVVRPRGSTETAVAAIRRALHVADPLLAPSNIARLETLVRQAHALPRLQMMLLVVFGIVATSIVALGSYGVMSQLVASREREFAIRLLFGAAPTRLGVAVLLQVAVLTVPGILAGALLVRVLAGLLRPFVFGVDPGSIAVSVTVSLGTLLLVGGATLAPARRASRVQIQRGIASV